MSRNAFFVIAALLASVAVLTWLIISRRYTTTPKNGSELRVLTSQFEKIAADSAEAIVAIRQPKSPGYATGAIVSSDGLVVSSFHVSHRLPWDGVAAMEHLNAGEMTTVVLANGTECDAELLGADLTLDISLLKLVAPGPYPYLKFSDGTKLSLGDWVLKLGHPTGLQRGRPPVVRAGRVVVSEPEYFVTDCNITGGDSGGPFIDLDGDIVGIPSALVADERIYANTRHAWARSKHGAPCLYSAIPTRQVLSNWKSMLDGQVSPFQGDTSRQSRLLGEVNRILPDAHWTRGPASMEPFRFVAQKTETCVVGILDSNGKQVSLGTICSSDGKVVTSDSVLPDTPSCRLHSGEIVDCNIVHRDERLNIAILEMDKESSHSIQWSTSGKNAVGTFVVAPLGARKSVRNSYNVGIASTPTITQPNTVPREYFEIDMRLTNESLGGPVVNLDCEATGISVQSNVYGTFVVPAAQVNALLEDQLN